MNRSATRSGGREKRRRSQAIRYSSWIVRAFLVRASLVARVKAEIRAKAIQRSSIAHSGMLPENGPQSLQEGGILSWRPNRHPETSPYPVIEIPHEHTPFQEAAVDRIGRPDLEENEIRLRRVRGYPLDLSHLLQETGPLGGDRLNGGIEKPRVLERFDRQDLREGVHIEGKPHPVDLPDDLGAGDQETEPERCQADLAQGPHDDEVPVIFQQRQETLLTRKGLVSLVDNDKSP